MPVLGPYSRASILGKLDGRSREARLMAVLRRELVAHVGGRPSATQQALIDRIAWLGLHLALMDRRTTEGRELSERDSRAYLAWSNSQARLLRQLGGPAKAGPPERTLADKLRERAGAVR